MDTNLRNISNKLVSGEKLSTTDLRSLEPLHDAIYDNDGRIVGISGSTTEEDDPLAGEFNLDYVDRSFLDGRHHRQLGQPSERLPRLVRYVGMVQDILDPEYYESHDSRGRSNHFGDHYDLTGNDDNDCSGKDDGGSDAYQMSRHSECLAERVPLVVVPIPFASDWLFRGIQARNIDSNAREPMAPKPAVVSPVSTIRGERKRGRNDVDVDGDSNMNGDHTPSSSRIENSTANQQTKQKKTTVSKGSATRENDERENGRRDNLVCNSTNATDWWPAGTCGTSTDECPVLAKMCYDELLSGEQDNSHDKDERETKEEHIEVETEDSRTRRNQRPLMLNDVVSMVGVLSMNPWDADFSGQKSSSMSSTNNGMDCHGWESTMAITNAMPPPSRLPRLHVLSYRRIDLDSLARRAINVEKRNYCKTSSNNDGEMQSEREGVRGASFSPDSDSDDDSEVEWSGFPTAEKSIPSSGVTSLLQESPSGSLSSPDAVPWIRALWLCLLSEADRQRVNSTDSAVVRAGPAERALGCVSLQLSTPDVASAKSLYRNLAENILPGVCPVVAAVDLTETTTESIVPLKDNNGRLQPCPLQLPKGSVLLVHCPPPSIDISNNGSAKKENDKLIQIILRELVQHHRIPYRFEGGVMIPFEADYRVIIVTTQTQDFPCTLTALTRTPTATPMAEPSTTRRCPTKPELREILVKGRSLNNNKDSLKFSSILLERAQRDFLERRRRCHDTSASSPLPGEDDFHKWLTLTKSQTKNRFSRDERSNKNNNTVLVEEEIGHATDLSTSTQYYEPSVEDWEAALQLDDDIRCII